MFDFPAGTHVVEGANSVILLLFITTLCVHVLASNNSKKNLFIKVRHTKLQAAALNDYYNLYGKYYTLFFIRINFIRILRLEIGEI